MATTTDPRHYAPWRELHQLQVTAAVLLLGFVPLGRLVETAWGSEALLVFAAVYGGLVLFVENRTINWKCPACGKPFLRKNGDGFALPYRARCGNCGLRHGAGWREYGHF